LSSLLIEGMINILEKDQQGNILRIVHSGLKNKVLNNGLRTLVSLITANYDNGVMPVGENIKCKLGRGEDDPQQYADEAIELFNAIETPSNPDLSFVKWTSAASAQDPDLSYEGVSAFFEFDFNKNNLLFEAINPNLLVREIGLFTYSSIGGSKIFSAKNLTLNGNASFSIIPNIVSTVQYQLRFRRYTDETV